MRYIALFTLSFSAILCQAQSLVVDGGNGKSITLTAADLAKLPQHTVRTTEHDAPASFTGVYLSDLLSKVDSPSGEALRKEALAKYLLAEAADGYKVVFALAEFDAAFTDRKILVATSRDGKPLNDKAGPFQMVVPDEKRPARWVRQLTVLGIH